MAVAQGDKRFWAIRERWTSPNFLRQNRLHRVCFLDAGQLLIQSLELVGKARMIDPHAMQNGGVDVSNVNWIFDDVIAEVIGLAVNHAAFDTASRHPHGEAAWMMVAAIISLGQFALAING